MATIISFSPDCVNETEGVNNKMVQGFTFPVRCFLFSLPFMIIVVLTLANRSVIITGQFNISADDNLSNRKHMKSSQSSHCFVNVVKAYSFIFCLYIFLCTCE